MTQNQNLICTLLVLVILIHYLFIGLPISFWDTLKRILIIVKWWNRMQSLYPMNCNFRFCITCMKSCRLDWLNFIPRYQLLAQKSYKSKWLCCRELERNLVPFNLFSSISSIMSGSMKTWVFKNVINLCRQKNWKNFQSTSDK